MRNIILYILLVSSLLSCSPYGFVSIQTESPAKAHISKDIKAITFVIRTSLSEKQNELIMSSQRHKDIYKVNQTIYDISFEGFYDVINSTDRYSRIMYYKEEPVITKDSLGLEPLNWVKAAQICTETGADLLVVLEDPFLYSSISQNLSNYVISWQYKYRIYDPYTFQIIDEYTFKDYSVIDSRMEGFSIENNIQYIAYSLGEKMAERIKPKYKEVDRLYYNKGNTILRLGAYYLGIGEYDKAIGIWKKLLESPIQSEDASKASLNISTAEELNNNLESSLRYANISLNYLKSTKFKDKELQLIESRIESLKTRIQEEEILNK